MDFFFKNETRNLNLFVSTSPTRLGDAQTKLSYPYYHVNKKEKKYDLPIKSYSDVKKSPKRSVLLLPGIDFSSEKLLGSNGIGSWSMASTKISNYSHKQALSFKHIEYIYNSGKGLSYVD